MRELSLAGLTEDGDLLLTTGDGQQYSLPVDDRLTQTLRDRPRPGAGGLATEGATPRDIQARVRHGESPEQISEQTGLPLSRVERFAGPPLAERAHVAERAGTTVVRREAGDATLLTLVVDALRDRSIDDDSLAWDAWRRDDGRWTVVARFAGGAGELALGEATWTYDAPDRTITAVDETARVLERGAAPPPEPPRMHLVVADSGPVDLDGPSAPWGEPTPAEVDRAAREWEHADPAGQHTQVVDRYSGDVVDLATGPPEQPDTPLDDLLMTDPGIAAPVVRPPSRRGRRKDTGVEEEAPKPRKQRAAVPTWDEILFGSRRPDE